MECPSQHISYFPEMLRRLLLTPLHRALCALPKPISPLSIALIVLFPSLFRPSPSLLIYKRTAGQSLLCPSRQDGVIMVRAVWGGCLMPPRNLV